MIDRRFFSPRPMATIRHLLPVLGCLAATGTALSAQDLQSFAVISGQSLTNTKATTIDGNIAVSPGTSYTGEGSVTQTDAVYLGDAVSRRIQNELTTLYTYLAGRPTSSGGDLTGQNLAGMVLTPGVYNFDSSANLASGGVLTFDARGNPDAVFIVNIGSTLTAESGARVALINGAQGGNVFYRVGSSATLGTSADLDGQIVALTSISMNDAAQVTCGAAYARNGSVTLIGNTITICRLTTAAAALPVTSPVAVALAEAISRGADLPIGLAIVLATQTPDDLARSLAQVSGQVATGLAPTGVQVMDGFLDNVMARGTRPALQAIAPRDQDVPPLMVIDKVNAPYLGGKGSRAAPDSAPMAFATMLAEPVLPVTIWAQAFGGRNVTDGDAGLDQQARTTTSGGLAFGATYAPRAGVDLGAALGVGAARFTLDDGAGNGDVDSVLMALHARLSSTSGYLAGGLAYGRHDMTTQRDVTIAGLDRLQGQTQADHIAAHIEAGYHLGVITPFAGLRAQSLRMDGYTETATAGTDTFALAYAPQDIRSLRSELGVQMQWDTAQPDGRATSLGLRAAWAHAFDDAQAVSGTLAAAPQIGFPVTGALRDSDQVLVSATIGTTLASGVSLQGNINGAYASNARDAGGSVTIGYRW